MSILACLIGILTLMISVSMQVKQIEDVGRTEEEKARAVENRELTKASKTLEASIAKLQKDLERDKATSAQLAKLEDRKIILKSQIAEASKDPAKTDEQLQKTIEVMREEIAALKKERPPLNKQLEELKAELALRRNPPEKVESVQIRPGGTGIRAASRLFFVECNSTGIVLLTGEGAPKTISQAAITKSPVYNSFLDEVKSTRDSMVLFLIRKSGAGSYNWAAGWAESKYEVLTGKLPVPNDGKIDLSLFQK
ncbi:hypothetical protein HZ994_13425 [Akkermansiaceae bacterium]|nr:hypothetical protein HZ994_13425 [Akkermansiaceae bacterium]